MEYVFLAVTMLSAALGAAWILYGALARIAEALEEIAVKLTPPPPLPHPVTGIGAEFVPTHTTT